MTYRLHLLTSNAARDLKPVAVWEIRLLKAIIGDSHLPNAVVRSVLGVPTPQTKNDLARLSEFMGLMATPVGEIVRGTLADSAAHLNSLPANAHARRGRLFLGGIYKLMDSMMAHPTASDSFCDEVDQLMEAAALPDLKYSPPMGFVSECRRVILAIENDRRQEALAALSSVAGVVDLLDSPNAMPFLAEPRSVGNQLRVRCMGDVRVLFGYEAGKDVSACPHVACQKQGGFSVRHLVSECSVLSEVRARVWVAALRCLAEADVMGADLLLMAEGGASEQDKSNADGRLLEAWYRLTMGASVEDSIVRLGLSRETHLARDKSQNPPRTPMQTAVYTHVLSITAELLEAVYTVTRDAILTLKGPVRMPRMYGARQLDDRASGSPGKRGVDVC